MAVPELFLTVKTVEYHMRNIYTKLDITGRQQGLRLGRGRTTGTHQRLIRAGQARGGNR
ncbi:MULTISPECIES: LuxR C-terminal-related transcriptional regulator [unclassified Pseudonocardia]|uniref:LuxR C-terminal-related transcriptional regulator n=1 Tax=unclassified Pseudonocardia TaxID=2619320 RepID=UPI000AA190DD|nr:MULTISPECIES: LuxR C-terminal-related transcriptional regulator [unclassified Pseudonocardia]MBN9102712.1 hypothetical protein [Pseudonocardia sp.]